MFRRLLSAPSPRSPYVCLLCTARQQPVCQTRLLSATSIRRKNPAKSKKNAANSSPEYNGEPAGTAAAKGADSSGGALPEKPSPSKKGKQPKRKKKIIQGLEAGESPEGDVAFGLSAAELLAGLTPRKNVGAGRKRASVRRIVDQKSEGPVRVRRKTRPIAEEPTPRTALGEAGTRNYKTLKEALLSPSSHQEPEGEAVEVTWSEKLKAKQEAREKMDEKIEKKWRENTEVKKLSADILDFQPIHVEIPPIPMLAHGLDRVLFSPGIYRLQDHRSRIYNFDPYLEKIMPVTEFDFEALSEYKTSSKDEKLLAISKQTGVKFTGSTSSMSGVLQHFHYLLSNWRNLNHGGLSRQFPEPSHKFTKITQGPSAIFLRWKDGMYAIDADKSHDSPNVMSWLGHSLEKLLTSAPEDMEKYRRSNPEQAPSEVESGKSYHYSKLGNFLMRSQLDAHDSRLPGTGVFDLKTRAVLPIRMNHQEYGQGAGYQLRYDHGEWESYERENYDMSRATLLKYSLQVRMGRMDGIFVAYHNVERIFGFQYISISDMDFIIHGQKDTCLGDQEFKLSVSLLDEMLQRAIAKYPNTSIRLRFETRPSDHPFMYIFAEPVTEAEVEEIQSTTVSAMKEFEQKVVKGNREDDAEGAAEERSIDELEKIKAAEEENDATVEAEEAEAEAEAAEMDAEVAETTGAADDVSSQAGDTSTTAADKTLTGWTLTCRSRVNGEYVKRPTELKPDDDYSIEYFIQEIAPASQQKFYERLTTRHQDLFDRSNKEKQAEFNIFRAKIDEYTQMGRRWRNEQDVIDEQMGKQVYRPLGPGSEKVT